MVRCPLPRFSISIHALREEGDAWPCRCRNSLGYFYPRPPRGGRPDQQRRPKSGQPISIHALREEGDSLTASVLYRVSPFLSTPSARRATLSWLLRSTTPTHFYPRPPRGGRLGGELSGEWTNKFLSTPSARRATQNPGQEESTDSNFYPRPPRGGRRPL